MKTPVEMACGEIQDCQAWLHGGRIPTFRTEVLVEAITAALNDKQYSASLEYHLGQFLLMLGRVAFACHSSVYATVARLYRSINPDRMNGDTEYAAHEEIRAIVAALPEILDTLSAEWALRPPSAERPDFGGIDLDKLYPQPPDPIEDPEGAAEWAEHESRRDYEMHVAPLFTKERVSSALTMLTNAAESFKTDQPPRTDAQDGIDFELLAEMVEQSVAYGHFRAREGAKHDDNDEWVHEDTPEFERQRQIMAMTMELVGEIRDYVARKNSSCVADLMKLESLLNAQEGPVHGVGFAKQLKALMDALWRESVTPEKPVVVVGGGTGGGRATPGPKMSSAKRDQQSMGVRDIENGRFKTPAAAAAHIVQLALPQWKDEGYTEKNRASLAQAIRRELQRAKRKKSLGAK